VNAVRAHNVADTADAAAGSFGDVADRVFDEISTTIESVIDPRPVDVQEIVAAEIRAHLPPESAEPVMAVSDRDGPPLRPFVRALRNELRSTARSFWRNVARGIGRSLKLLAG